MSDAPPLIVFDLDGTLISTAEDLVGALNTAMATQNLPPLPLAKAKDMIGAGAEALIHRGLQAENITPDRDLVATMLSDFLQHYEANIDAHSVPFPQVLEEIDALRSEGWRAAICTNKSERLARLLIDKLGLTDRFSALVGGDSLDVRKPDGRHILETVARAGGTPERSVMVGDSRPDIDAAKDAGIPVIAVDFGYTLEPVTEMAPDIVLSDFSKLAETAKRLVGAR